MALVIPLGATAKKPPQSAPTSQPEAPSLTLEAYVKRYLQLSNRIREAEIAVREQDVELLRRTTRSTMELSANPSIGLHHYRYTDGAGSDTLAVGAATAEWLYRRDNGQSLSIEAHTFLPTKQERLAGSIAYGVGGEYTLPLLRNRFGRQFAIEAEAQRHLQSRSRAVVDITRLQLCHDAVRRYIERYVAQQQLAVYRALLKEKQRIWRQTAADYRRKMITRLDMLAAKSDWITALSNEPEYRARLAQADAALRAFYPARGRLVLAEPHGLPSASEPAAIAEDNHPRFKEMVATQKALQSQQLLVVEENRSDLDLSLSIGLDRYHRSFPTSAAGMADTTDLHGLLGLRYLFPIKRPDIAFQDQLLRLSSRKVGEQRAELRRELLADARQAAAVAAEGYKALALLDEQARVVEQQIKAAFREFRAGKLQFQNFLDHWERYQAARLRRWEIQRQIWLAEAELIALLDRRPEFCR